MVTSHRQPDSWIARTSAWQEIECFWVQIEIKIIIHFFIVLGLGKNIRQVRWPITVTAITKRNTVTLLCLMAGGVE